MQMEAIIWYWLHGRLTGLRTWGGKKVGKFESKYMNVEDGTYAKEDIVYNTKIF
jgi:hypothetical protein